MVPAVEFESFFSENLVMAEMRGRGRAAADVPVPPETGRSRERPRAVTMGDANNRAVSRLSLL